MLVWGLRKTVALVFASWLSAALRAVEVHASESAQSPSASLDSWDFCHNFACPKYLVNDVTSSACLFGCRPAALKTLLSEQDCRKYCKGIQDQDQILRYTGNLTELERKFWRSVCEEGCKLGLRQQ